MLNKAIFLDRDGTINIDPGYIGDPKLVKLYPGVARGIKKLKDELGFLIVVISNQSGITRGLISSKDVDNVNNKINDLLAEENTSIDKFYYCPYHPDFDSQEKCKCRKPSPQLVHMAEEELNIDLTKSFFIGDRISDILCGINAGSKSILLTNTISEEEIIELQKSKNTPNFIATNFLDAVNYIERNIDGEIIEN